MWPVVGRFWGVRSCPAVKLHGPYQACNSASGDVTFGRGGALAWHALGKSPRAHEGSHGWRAFAGWAARQHARQCAQCVGVRRPVRPVAFARRIGALLLGAQTHA